MKSVNSNLVKRILRGMSLHIILLAVLFAANSCKHDNFEDFVGPSYCVSENFAYTAGFNVSSTSLDLNFTPLTMTAAFNETAAWTITITGQTSGAQKVFTGKSASVNQVWRGEPGSEVFFQAEVVTVEFKVPCKDPVTYNVTVTSPSNFTTFGALISDFDGNGMVTNVTTIGYNATGWSAYVTAPNVINEFVVKNTPLTGPVGSNYLAFRGQAGPASWFVGGYYATVSLSSLSTNNPDSIYFNAFVNGNGNSTTLLGITLLGSGGTKSMKLIDVNWTGWKMVSFKISEANQHPSAPPVTDTYLANAIDFGFNCKSAMGQPGEAHVDFVIFTEGKPFLE